MRHGFVPGSRGETPPELAGEDARATILPRMTLFRERWKCVPAIFFKKVAIMFPGHMTRGGDVV